MKEKIIIIFVALITGLFITSAGFFIYQSTKKGNEVDDTPKQAANPVPSPQTPDGIFVKVDSPTDETLSATRTINIKGSTNPENTVVISTNLQDATAKPESNGNFSIPIEIAAGANIIITRSIAPDGETAEDTRTVTFSTEEF